jgi:SagB-type dehydrogenase family enzyme
MKSTRKMASVIAMTMATLVLWTVATEPADITLPTPRMEGGKPLMQALKERQSSRAFSMRPLPAQMVADLLWAAFGINRPESGKRTAPSAKNWQEVEVYAVMPEGAYIYDAKANCLRAIAKGDLRKLTGSQAFMATTPLCLVYVVDTTQMKGTPAGDQTLYSSADVGFISQNVYLFCASEGLATVVVGGVNRDAMAKALNLPEHKRIIFAQPVGYPAAAGTP